MNSIDPSSALVRYGTKSLGAISAAPLAICIVTPSSRGNAGGERRFAQPRRPVEQNMPQRFAPLPGGIDRDFQPLRHLALADHVAHPLRPQNAIVLLRHHSRCGNLGGLNNRLAHLAG